MVVRLADLGLTVSLLLTGGGAFALARSDATRRRLDDQGNLAIGGPHPLEPLEVEGPRHQRRASVSPVHLGQQLCQMHRTDRGTACLEARLELT